MGKQGTVKNEPPDQLSAATITQLLNESSCGNQQAAAELLPLVYDQLRRLAARKLRQERPDQTLQAGGSALLGGRADLGRGT